MSQTQTAFGGESFAALFEESLKNSDMRVGEVISAEVVRIDHGHVVVNDRTQAVIAALRAGWISLA